MNNMLKVPQIEDGDKIILSQKNDYRMLQKCCDCGTLHIWEFEIVGESIHLKINRTTAEKVEDIIEFSRLT